MRRSLFILLVVFVLIGLLYNATLPLFEAPDEIWHYAFVDYVASGKGLPHFTNDQKPLLLRESGQPPLYYAIAATLVFPINRQDFPDFVRFNAAHPSINSGSTDDSPNLLIHTRHEDWPYQNAVLAAHLARLLSLLFGLLTVIGVYAIARLAAPDRPSLALAAAAIAAFTPQFVLISNAVSNDGLMAATATWTVWASVKFQIQDFKFKIEHGQSWRWAIALGVMLGLALLSKLSAIVLIPFVGLVLFFTWLRHPSRSVFYASLLVFLTAFLVAGWWYVRNWILYGDPLAWNVWLSDIGVRTPMPTLWQLVPEVLALFSTYWLEFTYGQSVNWLWIILAIINLAAIIGWIRILSNRSSQSYNPKSMLLLLGWLGILAISVIRYMQTAPDVRGRLLFPAIGATSLLLAIGLSAWRNSLLPAYGLAGGLLVLTLVAPFAFIRPAFAQPIVSLLPADATQTHALFGDKLELVGYRLSANRVQAGNDLAVTTYWRTSAPPDRDHRLLIRLLRENGESGGQVHATLGSSVYPTSLWRPDQIIVDQHTVSVDNSLQPGDTLGLQLGVGNATQPLLPVTGQAAWFTGDVADLGTIEVTQ